MTPPTVNAYYNPLMNEIVFPAGILQPPFFDLKADDAINYGGIGAVIGHEITHGFDDQGCAVRSQGNLRNWWTDDDRKNFDERATCVDKQFDTLRSRTRPAPERQAGPRRKHRRPRRTGYRLRRLRKIPGRETSPQRHRRFHSRAALLPRLGPSLGQQINAPKPRACKPTPIRIPSRVSAPTARSPIWPPSPRPSVAKRTTAWFANKPARFGSLRQVFKPKV